MFYRLKQIILSVGDLIMLYIGLYLGILVRNLGRSDQDFLRLISSFSILFFFAIIIIFIVGLYDVGRARNSISFFEKIGISAAIWFVGSVFYFYINPSGVTPKTTLLLVTIISFFGISIWRAIYNQYLSTNLLQIPIAFVGYNSEIEEIISVLKKFPEHGYVLAGIIYPGATPADLPKANSLEDLVKLNKGQYPGVIVISENAADDPKNLTELYGALYRQVSIFSLSDFYEEFFKRIPPFTFSESWFISNIKEQNRKIYDRFKLLMDFVIALLMGIFFIFTFPIVAALIKFSSKGPIFFKQQRTGRLGHKFNIYKYRTMKALNDDGSAEIKGAEYAKENDTRITTVGKFLRQTRIDEIPQLINILRGEMAIIGPRPERPEFVEQLTKQMPFYSLRHLVKPGITGWAQLQHSYYGTIEENLVKLQYDLYYVKNRNLILDTAILLRTFSVLARFMGR